ncbi:proteasome subunit alpha-type 8 [Alca torda]
MNQKQRSDCWCQNSDEQLHKLTLEGPVTVEYTTHCFSTLAAFPQSYTQSNGSRPFGASALTVGFNSSGSPELHQMDPSGTYQSWKVFVIDSSRTGTNMANPSVYGLLALEALPIGVAAVPLKAVAREQSG